MALERILMRVNGPAAADLSAKQFYALQRVSGTDFGFNLATAATQKPGGILQNKPTSGKAVDAATFGVCKAIAGGTIHNGDYLTTDANGKLIATTTDHNNVWGQSLSEAVDGDVFTMFVFPSSQISL